jgi:hypothetical protein
MKWAVFTRSSLAPELSVYYVLSWPSSDSLGLKEWFGLLRLLLLAK